MEKEEQELITLRVPNKKVYRKFRIMVLSKRRKLGREFNQALKYWMEIEGNKEEKDPRKLLKSKPVDLGPGSENLSTTLDEVLYG